MTPRLTAALLTVVTAIASGGSWLLHDIGLPDVVLAGLIAGQFAAFTLVIESLRIRRTTPEDRVADLLAHHALQPAWLVAIYAFIYIELIERGTAAYLGGAIGTAIEATRESTSSPGVGFENYIAHRVTLPPQGLVRLRDGRRRRQRESGRPIPLRTCEIRRTRSALPGAIPACRAA